MPPLDIRGMGGKRFRMSRNTNLLPHDSNRINFEQLPIFPIRNVIIPIRFSRLFQRFLVSLFILSSLDN